MSFWNNPQNSALKIIVIAAVVIGAGFFVYRSKEHDPAGTTGRVIDTQSVTNAASGTIPAQNITSVSAQPLVGSTPSAGGLKILANSAYGDQTVPVGTAHFKVGSYLVTNLSTAESVHVTGFMIGFTGLPAAATSELTNLSVSFNGSPTTATAATLPTTAVTGILPASNMIAPGATATIDIYADISATATSSFRSNLITFGVGTTSGTHYATAPVGGSATGAGYSGQAVYLTAHSVSTGGLVVSKNSAYADQTVPPNTPHEKIGSFSIQNTSTTDTYHVTNLQFGWAVPGTSVPLSDFANLVPVISGVSPLTPIVPTLSNNFAVSLTIAPGASTTVDVYADLGSLSFSFQSLLNVSAVDTATSAPVTTGTVAGQTIIVSGACSLSPALVTASSTVSQYVATGTTTGVANATQATFKLVSPTATTVNGMKISVVGANSATAATLGSVTAPFVGGVANFTGLSIAVPAGTTGANVIVYISYPPVGPAGLPSGTTSTVSLTYLRFTCGSTVTSSSPSISAPTVTLVGSDLSLSVPSIAMSGLILGAVNQIGQVTVAANASGNISLNQIKFTVANSGFSAGFNITGATIDVGTTAVAGATCMSSSSGATCVFATPYVIPAGNFQTFNLYANVTGTAIPSATVSVSSSLDPLGFKWTDVAGGGASGAYNGVLVHDFPTNSYLIHQ